jgi:hypothetical protein
MVSGRVHGTVAADGARRRCAVVLATTDGRVRIVVAFMFAKYKL